MTVDESFNPYRKWFGIPLKEQPPHYYRLLGLEPFEGDPDAILYAVDARMVYLKSQLAGPQRSEAERLRGEVTEAQAVLLNPEKKAAYDRQLQSRLAAERPPGAVKAAILSSVAAPPPLLQPRQPAWKANIPSASSAGVRRIPASHGWSILLSVLLAAGIILSSLIAILLLNKMDGAAHQEDEKTSAASGRLATAAPEEQFLSPVTADSPVSSLLAKTAGTKGTPAAGKNQTGAASPATTLKSSVEPSTPHSAWSSTAEEPASEGATTSPPPEGSEGPPPQTTSSPPEGPNRRQEPKAAFDLFPKNDSMRPEVLAEADRLQAEKNILKFYGKRIAAAKSNPERLALAKELRKQASHPAGSAAERYALLRLSLRLTAEAGQLHQALADAESLEEIFPGDMAALKVEVVIQAVQALRTGAKEVNPFEILAVSPAVIEEARQAGRFEEAGRLVQLVTPLARLAKDQNLLHGLAAQGREIDRLKTLSASVGRALKKLRENPDDPEANGLAGRWIAFQLQDWRRGLPLLAKSSDSVLAKLAAADVADPQQSALQAELADGYWDAAQKEQGTWQTGILARAEFWYRQARPGLREVAKIQVAKRLEALDAQRQARKGVRGAVQPGNVALARNGTLVEGVERNGFALFDGQVRNGSPAASSPVPCQWTVTFDKVYQLQEIRFKLNELNRRNFFRYTVSISPDGVNFQPVAVRTQEPCFGWQQVRILSQPVKAVTLLGVLASQGSRFMVDEFEAYCIAPKP